MKRDMDLVRKILLEIEKHPYTGGWIDVHLEEYTSEEVVYHLKLLAEAALIEAHDVSSHSGMDLRPVRLTWEGHEFLDAARDDTRWNKAKETITKVGGISLEIVKLLLLDLMKTELNLS